MKGLASAIAGAITLWLMFPVFFDDREEFFEAIKFWLTPDIVSMFKGNYWEGGWAEFKLFVWIACAGGISYGLYHLF